MSPLVALMAFSGLGLVLFGLRVFMQTLDETVAARSRPLIAAVTRGTLRPLATGFGVTLVLQASSVTVIALLGLLQTSLIPLEAALLVMLGATVGTCAKAWLFTLPFAVLGPLLVGGASVALVLARRYVLRTGLQLAFALGLVFLGWHLVAVNLEPALRSDALTALLEGLDVATPAGLLGAICFGVLLTAAVNSSSTVVFLLLVLVETQALPLPLAAAVVLGANVGTTATPLFASLEYRVDVRRLALAHTLVKLAGVLVAACFFRSFLTLAAALTEPLGATSGPARLAAVHTVFNLINALVWIPLVPRLARLLRGRAARAPFHATAFLAAPVRRILANVPDEALEELARARDRALQELKLTSDRMLAALEGSQRDAERLEPRHDLLDGVVAGQELLSALALRNPWTPAQQRLRAELDALHAMVLEDVALVRSLQLEPHGYRQLRLDHLRPGLAGLRHALEVRWHDLLTGGAEPRSPDDLDAAEGELLERLRGSGRVTEADLTHLGRQLAHVRRIAQLIEELALRGHLASEDDAPSAAAEPATPAAAPPAEPAEPAPSESPAPAEQDAPTEAPAPASR